MIFVRWGSTPGQAYAGTGPLSWAHTTARLQSEAERSLADEAQGPLAQLLAVPQDGGGDSGPPGSSSFVDEPFVKRFGPGLHRLSDAAIVNAALGVLVEFVERQPVGKCGLGFIDLAPPE